jgi:hypothetical protein
MMSFLYIGEKEAKYIGFTHHGSYYGFPVWIADDEDFSVAAKFHILEWVIPVISYVEMFISNLMGYEEAFMFKIGEKI